MSKTSVPDINEVLRLKHVFGDGQPLAIIPILVREKVPAQPWRESFEDGPRSDDWLRVTWSRWRGQVNPGMACGPLCGPGGRLVVDADNAEAIAWCRGHLPPTPVMTETRQGLHYHYRYPTDLDVDVNFNRADILGSRRRFEHEAREAGFDVVVRPCDSAEALLSEKDRAAQARADALASGLVAMGPVIDIRGRGGQVLLPGSVHPSGFRYRAVDDWHGGMVLPVFETGLVEGLRWQPPARTMLTSGLSADEYLRERLRADDLSRAVSCTYDEKIRRARGWLARADGAVAGAGGHNRLFYVACSLVKGFLLSPEDALALIVSDYNPRCSPEWSHGEIEHKVHDAARLPSADDGSKLADRQEWLASRAIRREYEYVPAASTDGPDPEAYGDDTVNVEVSESPAQPPPTPSPGGSDGSDIEKQWRLLWAGKGVDYDDVRDREWDRQRVSGGAWQLPPTTNNLVLALEFSSRCQWQLAYNEQMMAKEIDGRKLRDEDERTIHGRLCYLWQSEVARERSVDAVARVCASHAYDPWHVFMDSLPEWDGGDHLATLVDDVLGIDAAHGDARDQAYREWRHQLTGCVARGLAPGTKVETIMIMVGGQGHMKSTFLRELFNGRDGRWDFFTDQKFRLDDKDGQMLISRYHACEWGEAEHAKNPKAIDTIKAFLAQRVDVFRPPYGRNLIDRPRRVVFFGTSNETEGLLHDATGNRRFYVTHIGSHIIDLVLLDQIRSQLWSQVLAYYRWHRAGRDEGCVEAVDATRWWYTVDEERSRADSLRPYVAQSAYHEVIEAWLATRTEPFRQMDVMEDVLKIHPGQADKRLIADVLATIIRLGCRRINDGAITRVNGRVGRWWQPPPASSRGEDDADF